MADEKSHNDIYQAVGRVSGQVEGLRQEIHDTRVSQLAAEKRQLEEFRKIRQDHLMYGRRIANLERAKTWVIGAAAGVVLVVALVAADAQEFIHRITK